MSMLRQIVVVSSINLRNLPRRATASSVLVGSVAGVVAVLVSVLAMGVGFTRTLAGTGHSDRAIIISAAAQNEASSSIPPDEVASIVTAPGIRHSASGDPIADAELLVQFQVPRKTSGKPVNIALRGIGKSAAALRPDIRLVKGRMFRPGLHEIIVGRTAEAQYGDLDIGSHVRLAGGDWKVVGTFQSDDTSALDSGALGDAEALMAAYHHDWFNSITVRLDGPGALHTLRRALESNLAMHVEVRRESSYFAAQSRPLSVVLKFIGYFVGGLMAVGALFSALNTMYWTVRTRGREIATLRAMGFGGAAVVISVLTEAIMLAGIGALIGALCAWFFFNGHVASIPTNDLQPSVAFAMSVTPGLAALGTFWACAIGVIGGLFPAIRAARLPVARIFVSAAR